MDGWIKLHRKFSEWEWYHKSEMVHLFIHLLLNANHDDKKWKGLTVKRGQIITGFHSLSDATGLSIQTIRTCFDRLTKTGEINKQSNKQFTVVTICNYETYQIKEENTNKQNNNRTTNNQQTTNNKQELKNNKNEKNINKYKPILDKIAPFFDLSDISEKSWIEVIRMLIENDKYSEQDIFNVVKWARNDNFWRSNFQSILKLRRKNQDGITYMKVFIEKANNNNSVNGSSKISSNAINKPGSKYHGLVL